MSKGKDFFKSAGLKLNREIKAERQKQAKGKTKEGAFIKQVRAEQDGKRPTKQVAESQAFQPFEGKQVVPPKKIPKTNFEVDPEKAEEQSPNKGFSDQVNWNANQNGVK